MLSLYSLIDKERVAEHGIIIDVYNFAIENFEKRFVITEDHIIATILDPSFKKLALLDKFIPSGETRESLLQKAIKSHNIDVTGINSVEVVS